MARTVTTLPLHFSTRILYVSVFSGACHMPLCRATYRIESCAFWSEQYKSWNPHCAACYSCCYFLPLRSSYPQYPVSKYPQSVFFQRHDVSSITYWKVHEQLFSYKGAPSVNRLQTWGGMRVSTCMGRRIFGTYSYCSWHVTNTIRLSCYCTLGLKAGSR
jgi:hypothetical protein